MGGGGALTPWRPAGVGLGQSEEALRKSQQQLHDAELSSEQRVRELEGLVARLQDSVRAMEGVRTLR